MVTEWRAIAGYEGLYEVGSDGQVRSLDRIDGLGRLRKGRSLTGGSSKGYRNVMLSKDGVVAAFTVHRLVALAFVVGDSSQQIRHLDGNRENNAASNLAWGTAAENSADRDLHGTTARGEKSTRAKLTESRVAQIREYGRQGLGCAAIGRLVNMHRARVYEILVRRTWKHVA